MSNDEQLSLFLAADTEYQLRQSALEQLMAAYDSPYDRIDFCIRYIAHPVHGAAQLCALRLEGLVFRTLVPEWPGRPREVWSPPDAAIRERLIQLFHDRVGGGFVVRVLAALAYEGIIDRCVEMLEHKGHMWHTYGLISLCLLNTPQATSTLVDFFRTTPDERRRNHAAESAAWTDHLVEPARSEIEEYLLAELPTAKDHRKVMVLFALALLKNPAAVAELTVLAHDESLSKGDQAMLRTLTSQKLFGVFDHPDWKPTLLAWLRDRNSI